MPPPDETESRIRDWLSHDLTEIAQSTMPFGKYGPDHYPPRGIPIYDLPLEYLQWFARKGFPKGRLGDLLRMLHQLKADGCDEVFDEIRRRRGGRTDLRL